MTPVNISQFRTALIEIVYDKSLLLNLGIREQT